MDYMLHFNISNGDVNAKIFIKVEFLVDLYDTGHKISVDSDLVEAELKERCAHLYAVRK